MRRDFMRVFTRTSIPVIVFTDESRKFFVALPAEEVDKLRGFLMEACEVFQQKCIYLSVGGEVEFVYRISFLN